jgi:hypothetical protein
MSEYTVLSSGRVVNKDIELKEQVSYVVLIDKNGNKKYGIGISQIQAKENAYGNLEKKNTPMKPRKHHDGTDICPSCVRDDECTRLVGFEKYCTRCGQALLSGDNKPLQNESGE